MLTEEHPECLRSHSLRSTHTASQRYLTRDVRQKYMPPAIVYFERRDSRQELWRDVMTIRTTEASQQEYPETAITTTGIPDRRAIIHSRNIPEARRDMISGFPNPVLATLRPKSGYSRKMNSTLQRSARAQATFYASLDHEGKCANRAVQLIAGRHHFRAEGGVVRRSGTGPAGRRAGRVPSLPFLAINPLRQPAIPDGGR